MKGKKLDRFPLLVTQQLEIRKRNEHHCKMLYTTVRTYTIYYVIVVVGKKVQNVKFMRLRISHGGRDSKIVLATNAQ